MAPLAAGRGRFGRRAHAVSRPQEGGGARHDAFALGHAVLDLDRLALDDAGGHAPFFDTPVAHDVEARPVAVASERGGRRAEPVAPNEVDLAGGEGADA